MIHPQPSYSLSDVLDAIIISMRPKCSQGIPAGRDGRVCDGDHMLEWPIHQHAFIVKRLNHNTVLVRCPLCKYRWATYNTTGKRGGRPWSV